MSEKRVTIGGSERTAVLDGDTVTVGNASARLLEIMDGEALVEVGGRKVLVPYSISGDSVELILDGEHVSASVTDPGSRRRGGGREHSMAAPMPGVVLKILVEEGAAVAKGTPLVVLEAMKMEHQIRAPRDGKVAAVRCSVGELVQPGVDLIELQEESA